MEALYADAETLLAAWLHTTLNIKTWVDPKLPPRWDYTSPLTHIQRSPGDGDTALTLDTAVLDVDVYAALADNARVTAERIRRAVRLELPLHTTADGTFIQSAQTVMAPVWLSDPAVFRRSATYRLFLHSPL